MPVEIRIIFGTIIQFGDPSDPKQLWEDFKDPMIEDFVRLYKNDRFKPLKGLLYNSALLKIEEQIIFAGGSWTKDLPKIDRTMKEVKNFDIAHEYDYDVKDETRISIIAKDMLSDEQRKIYNQTYLAIEFYELDHNIFFVDGPAGTSKTFFYTALFSYVRSQRQIALACASSVIAALLLSGGRTGHSRFKIPLKLISTSMCSFDSKHPLVELIKNETHNLG